jgi:NADP-dependent 3-hydroxy acid dehydrogenase YdfG
MTVQRLTGAVALVTGAGNGVGEATARRLAGEGAAVALVGRRLERLEQVAMDIMSGHGVALVVQADITQPELAEQAVTQTLERLGRLDVLVNSAGLMLLGTALHAELMEWDRMTAVNIMGMLHVTHEAVPYLIDAAVTSPRAVADIVNVGSTAGRVASAGGSVYNLTEFGINGFSEALRQELLGEGVRVAVVAPDPAGPLSPDVVADAIAYVVTRGRRLAINEIVIRAGPPG